MKKLELYDLVKSIPLGAVCTYGALARALGEPHGARSVGRLLHQNKEPRTVPCHRVVFKDGSLTPAFAFGGGLQRAWLGEEGVTFIGDKVNMNLHFYAPTADASPI